MLQNLRWRVSSVLGSANGSLFRPAPLRGLLIAVLVLPGLALATEARDQNGQSHAWQAPLERLTVIDFAASWCAPCRHSLPKLEILARSHPEVDFLVVSVDDTQEGRDALVRSLDLDLPVLWDEGYAIAEHYEPQAMPSTFVVDTAGEVVYSHRGSSERAWREFVAFIEAASGAGNSATTTEVSSEEDEERR